MKNIAMLLTALVILLWTYGTAFAPAKGRGRGATGAKAGTYRKGARAVRERTDKDKGRQQKSRPQAKAANRQAKGKPEEPSGKPSRNGSGKKARGKKGRLENAAAHTTEKSKGSKAAEQAVDKRGAAGENIGKGNGHQQQLKALEEKVLREQEKHNRRVVRLNRIRELAQKQGKTETVQRVDKLLAKEQERYERTQQRMEQARGKIIKLQTETLQRSDKPRGKKVSAGKVTPGVTERRKPEAEKKQSQGQEQSEENGED